NPRRPRRRLFPRGADRHACPPVTRSVSSAVMPDVTQLLDAAAGIDLTAVRLERVNADGSVTQVTLQDAGTANPGNLLRYDAGLHGYIFTLSTKGLGAGTYNFYWIADGDQTEHKLSFRLV